MKVYLDPNIFILPVISKSSEAERVKEALTKVEEGEITALTSPLTGRGHLDRRVRKKSGDGNSHK